jgi:DDE superfamily endonuclease
MEDVLDLYHEPYDPAYPVVCFDEGGKQLFAETRIPLPMLPGQAQRFDYEYERCGTANLFMFFEPLAAWRQVTVTDQHTMLDFAHCLRDLVDIQRPEAKLIRVVLDNLSTHSLAALYEAFEPAEARRLAQKLAFHYTPKHGSWLNMAEIELGVLQRQCLDRRIDTKAFLTTEVQAWQQQRNLQTRTVNWHFSTADARLKLRKLYPSFNA